MIDMEVTKRKHTPRFSDALVKFSLKYDTTESELVSSFNQLPILREMVPFQLVFLLVMGRSFPFEYMYFLVSTVLLEYYSHSRNTLVRFTCKFRICSPKLCYM